MNASIHSIHLCVYSSIIFYSIEILLRLSDYYKPTILREMLIKLMNCRKIVDGHLKVNQCITIKDGFIVDDLNSFYHVKDIPNHTIDCQNFIISAGFIDVQVNGNLNDWLTCFRNRSYWNRF